MLCPSLRSESKWITWVVSIYPEYTPQMSGVYLSMTQPSMTHTITTNMAKITESNTSPLQHTLVLFTENKRSSGKPRCFLVLRNALTMVFHVHLFLLQGFSQMVIRTCTLAPFATATGWFSAVRMKTMSFMSKISKTTLRWFQITALWVCQTPVLMTTVSDL